MGGGAGGQVGGAGGQCLIEGVAGMAVWAEVLVLGASACAGDLAAKARRCGLAIARWRSCCVKLKKWAALGLFAWYLKKGQN